MRKKILALGLILILLCGGASFIYLRFLVRLVHVPTAAMANTIVPGDNVIIHKSFGSIERGEVVLFSYPGESIQYIARVVGLPGETIQIRDKLVFVNDHPLDEERVFVKPPDVQTQILEELSTEGRGPYRVYVTHSESEMDTDFATMTPFQIPRDSYFMLGDDRDNSNDSRYRGPVPRDLIWGSASMIYYSIEKHSGELRSERLFKKIR